MYSKFRTTPNVTRDSLIQMFYLIMDFNSISIFELPGINLGNRILISSQNTDHKKLASSTVRPKL